MSSWVSLQNHTFIDFIQIWKRCLKGTWYWMKIDWYTFLWHFVVLCVKMYCLTKNMKNIKLVLSYGLIDFSKSAKRFLYWKKKMDITLINRNLLYGKCYCWFFSLLNGYFILVSSSPHLIKWPIALKA